MHNHYHLVIFIDHKTALSWTDKEVIERWSQIYKIPKYAQKYINNESISNLEQEDLTALAQKLRKKLMCLSDFMKNLNEYIAKRANKEDECTGHFWESRFKSQALLDEQALLSCMAYVDLNPVRAKISERPENSEFTSIKQRSEEFIDANQSNTSNIKLLQFIGERHQITRKGIPSTLEDYLDLIDWT